VRQARPTAAGLPGCRAHTCGTKPTSARRVRPAQLRKCMYWRMPVGAAAGGRLAGQALLVALLTAQLQGVPQLCRCMTAMPTCPKARHTSFGKKFVVRRKAAACLPACQVPPPRASSSCMPPIQALFAGLVRAPTLAHPASRTPTHPAPPVHLTLPIQRHSAHPQPHLALHCIACGPRQAWPCTDIN